MKGAAKAEFESYLDKKGLRLTKKRSLILDVFLGREGHLTSEDLYRLVKSKDGSVGQATVYRTLKLLSDSGIARVVDFGEGVQRYEHEFGHEHHDHIICLNCKRSIEVLDTEIETLQERLAERHGFSIKGHKMDIFGVCGDCAKKGGR